MVARCPLLPQERPNRCVALSDATGQKRTRAVQQTPLLDLHVRALLLIEGDDGTRLTKQQIVTALKSLDTGETSEHAV